MSKEYQHHRVRAFREASLAIPFPKISPTLVFATIMATACFASSASAQSRFPRTAPFMVTQYGAKCDGTTDDFRAIQATLNAAAGTCTYANNFATYTPVVSFPFGGLCKVNSGLARSNCVSVEGNQTTLNFTALTSNGIAMTVVVAVGQSVDAQNGETGIYLENLHMNGPGNSSVGIQLDAAGGVYRDLDLHNFGVGVRIGNNGFLHLFEDVSVANYGIAGFSCPAGLMNAGENERWSGGGIYNGFASAPAIDNQGCEFNGYGLSIDFPSGPFIKNATGIAQSTASTKLSNFHLERNSDPADPAIDIGGGSGTAGGCNSWSHVVLTNGAIINNAGGTVPNSLAIVRNNAVPCVHQTGQGGWVIIQNTQIAGWNASAPCAVDDTRDPDATCIIGSGANMVKLQNVSNGSAAGMAFLNAGP